jgi:hypothetical protein
VPASPAQVVAPYTASKLCTRKQHDEVHLVQDIRDVGEPAEHSAEGYEHSHTYIKRSYRATSKKRANSQAELEVAKRMRTTEAVERRLAEQQQEEQLQEGQQQQEQQQEEQQEGQQRAGGHRAGMQQGGAQQQRTYCTAYMRAAKESCHQLASTRSKVSLVSLDNGGRPLPGPCKASAQLAAKLLGEELLLGQLPLRLREFFDDEQRGEAREAAAAAAGGRLQRRTQAELPQLEHATIATCKSAVLAAECSWAEELQLQTVRATTSFHHRPRQDVVRVRRATGGRQGNRAEEFAQLLLLFEYGGRQLAFVRWFTSCRALGDVLASYGCQRVKFAEVRDPGSKSAGAKMPDCTVIDLAAVLRREYCILDYSDSSGTAYHISTLVRIKD